MLDFTGFSMTSFLMSSDVTEIFSPESSESVAVNSDWDEELSEWTKRLMLVSFLFWYLLAIRTVWHCWWEFDWSVHCLLIFKVTLFQKMRINDKWYSRTEHFLIFVGVFYPLNRSSSREFYWFLLLEFAQYMNF